MDEIKAEVKPSTAKEFLELFNDEKVLKKLTCGLTVLLRKVDVQEILTSGPLPMPLADTSEELIGKATKEEKDSMARSSMERIRNMVIAAVESPMIVLGTVSNVESNTLAWDDPKLPNGLKQELIAHVFDFNGYSEAARKFFRTISL